jgi:hypothetical protein
MTNPDTTAAVNRILLRTATNAEPIVDRNEAQKAVRIGKMRAELIELGYSVVTTAWLNSAFDKITAAKIASEKGE